MKHKAAAKTTQLPSGKSSVLGTIGTDLLDTAWRIALPVLLLAVIGIMLDRKLNTAPWITLAASLIGLVIAGFLVKRQLVALEEKEKQ